MATEVYCNVKQAVFCLSSSLRINFNHLIMDTKNYIITVQCSITIQFLHYLKLLWNISFNLFTPIAKEKEENRCKRVSQKRET